MGVLDRAMVEYSRKTVTAVANELDMVGSVVRDLAQAVAMHDAELFARTDAPNLAADACRPTACSPLHAPPEPPRAAEPRLNGAAGAQARPVARRPKFRRQGSHAGAARPVPAARDGRSAPQGDALRDHGARAVAVRRLRGDARCRLHRSAARPRGPVRRLSARQCGEDRPPPARARPRRADPSRPHHARPGGPDLFPGPDGASAPPSANSSAASVFQFPLADVRAFGALELEGLEAIRELGFRFAISGRLGSKARCPALVRARVPLRQRLGRAAAGGPKRRRADRHPPRRPRLPHGAARAGADRRGRRRRRPHDRPRGFQHRARARPHLRRAAAGAGGRAGRAARSRKPDRARARKSAPAPAGSACLGKPLTAPQASPASQVFRPEPVSAAARARTAATPAPRTQTPCRRRIRRSPPWCASLARPARRRRSPRRSPPSRTRPRPATACVSRFAHS